MPTPTTGGCVIVGTMSRVAARILMLTCLPPILVWGQVSSHCLPQGRPVAIVGNLARVDENGYRQWIALRPLRPVCTLADPTDEFSDAVDEVTEIQVFAADDAEEVHSQLERLIGKKAVVSGELSQWHTGYQRAAVVLDVHEVRALDATGEAALRTPEPPRAVVREVTVYDISIQAGESLVKEARELGTGKVLEAVDEYAPHWVTGGDVVYVHCRDGYDVEFVKGSIAKDDALCGLVGNSCGFGIPEHGTITVTMRCTRPR